MFLFVKDIPKNCQSFLLKQYSLSDTYIIAFQFERPKILNTVLKYDTTKKFVFK